MAPGLIESNGAQSKKQSPWGNVFVESIWEGLYTNRAALHSSGSLYENKYLGGRPGSLVGGLNTEISVRNTLARRPGLSSFSTFVYPNTPNITYSFQVSDGTIRVIVDTASTPTFAIASVATSIGSSAVYTGTITGGGSNAFAGLIFSITGFNNPNNNGTFVCTASSTTTLTLSNAIATAESTASTAISAGAVYWDQQNGSAQMLFAKGPGAGQTHFIGVGGVLYMGDGVETRKYTPLNLNTPPGSSVSVWNWGIVAPTTQPTVTSVASGSAATVWQANTFFTTMGLTVDTNATPQIWQLIGVNANGTNTPNAQFGTAGNGNPPWNQATYGTTTESSGTPIVWKNLGQLQQWQGGFTYGDAGIAGTAAPVGIYDLTSGSIYLNFNNSGGLSVSGHTKPAFNGVAGSSFWDNQCHWFFYAKFAQCQPWKANQSYTQWYNPGGTAGTTSEVANSLIEPFILPPPTNNPIYLQVPTNTGTSGSSYAPFPASAGIGTQQPDAQLNWLSLGQAAWQASNAYPPFTVFGSTFGCVKDTNGNMQVATSNTGSGLSGTIKPGTSQTASTVASNAVGGNTTYTGTFSPILPTGYPVTISGFTNAANNGTFTVISCSATVLVVNNPSGTSETHSATFVFNPWGTTYGSHINDGGIVWTCVGPPTTWVAGSATTGIWNLPPSGFQPPSAAQAYGGSTIDSSTALVETVIISGKSGTSAPSWNAIHTTTTDNTITWYAESAVSTQSLSWTKGFAYAYSFKARAFDDFYSPAPLGGGNVPPGGVPLTAPTGSATEAISTASPAFIITGANAGAVNTVTGLGSTDPQVDTIVIWRSDDGGGSGQMFELTEIPAPPPIGGIAQPWSFQDFLPDTATNTFPGLNTQIPAPIDESNDPPTNTFRPMAYNFTRIWGSDGSFVPFSGGPDVLTGNPNEAFAPADALPFLAPVIRSVKTTQGLLTFTTSSIEIILGGPLTSSFFSVTIGPGIGLSGYNALDIFAGETFFLDTVGELRVVSPTLSVTTAGFAIADQLLLFNPKTAYVTFADLPNDSAIYVGTGSTTYNGNTGWFRMNPHQIPGSINGPEPVWSPFAAVTNGCQMVQAIEISPGVKKLLVGPAGSGSILERNSGVFTDAGSTYDANAQLGSLFLAHRGELALLRFIEADFALVTTNPTMSYLLNEISGAFSNFTTSKALFDPPSLYGRGSGPLGTPSSYNPLRFYFADQGTIARCVHMQIGIDFGSTSNADEVFNLTIEGAIVKNQ